MANESSGKIVHIGLPVFPFSNISFIEDAAVVHVLDEEEHDDEQGRVEVDPPGWTAFGTN